MNTGCEVQLARAPIINENLCGLLIDFEELVKSQSYSVAVTFQNKSITYLDLNKQANQLARYLRNQGIKGEELIAIFMGNSLQMIITILGILKAGGAYVPIDIHFPEERIQYILKDTGVNVIITQDCFLSRFEKNAITAISLDRIWCKISQELTTDLDVTISPHALAYVIYTSGSTGKPKGVMIEHGSISDKLRCLKSIYAINASDVFLFYRSAAYDASIEEYLLPLISGAKIVVVDHESNQDLISLLVENISLYKITILGFLPSLLSYFLAYLEATKCINQCWNLTRITVGGEMFPVQLAHRLLSVLPLRIYNVYGPTENTIDATVYEFKYLKQTSRCVPIGLPLAGTATYVLNSFGRPVRPGKIGELYIGGSGLARGYLNQPELTAEKFIKNPFGSGRLYKTGDLVRQLPDGNLEFIGRVDNQIKIRGYRIELDEINYYVQQYTDVSQSIVMAFDSARNEKYIVAYIVLVKDCMAREDRLKLYLKKFLPDYMIPAKFIFLEKLPLTTSGKIDKGALPKLDFVSRGKFCAPQSKLERELTSLWEEILNLTGIGVEDNFFELGGHSLLALEMAYKLGRQYDMQLNTQHLYRYPTIRALAAFLEKKSLPILRIIPVASQQSSAKRYFPLSASQSLIWMHQQFAPETPIYNESFHLTIHEAINADHIEDSLNKIVERHEILRARIVLNNGAPNQYFEPYQPFKLPRYDFRDRDIRDAECLALRLAQEDLKKCFKYGEEPLIRFLWVRLTDKTHRLYVVAHHCISDGVSMFQLFLNELQNLHAGKQLTSPGQYKDYVIFHRALVKLYPREKDICYWETKLQDLPFLKIESKKEAATCLLANHAGHMQYMVLPEEMTNQLREFGQQQGVTLFAILISAFYTLLYHYTHCNDLAIGTVLSGRDHLDTQNMMGNFLNTVILRLILNPVLSFQTLLQQVKREVYDAHLHQRLPFQDVVNMLHKKKLMIESDRHLLPFSIAFIYEPSAIKLNENWVVSQCGVHNDTSKFDLLFELDDKSNEIIGRIEYKTDVFLDIFITRMIKNYITIITCVLSNPASTIEQLRWMHADEESVLLRLAGKGYKRKDCSNTVVDLFENFVDQHPEQAALAFLDSEMTYRVLNQRANQMAHYIKAQGVMPKAVVAVYMERSIDVIVCLLAIAKVGAVYVSIHLESPVTVVHHILRDAAVTLLLTKSYLISDVFCSRINLDHQSTMISDQPLDNLSIKITSEDLAYIIYTSGSTGEPKGIALAHRTLINLSIWQHKQLLRLASSKSLSRRVAQFAAFTFDVSLQEIFYALSFGHTLYLIPEELRHDVIALAQYVDEERIQDLFLPTSVLRYFADAVLHLQIGLKYLENIIVAGEALRITDSIKQFFIRYSQVRLMNQYGPSETHVVSEYRLPDDLRQWVDYPPIGQPIAGTELYVLNNSRRLAPLGAMGELYIGGLGVARGYVNSSQLTAEKFIDNIFSSDMNKSKLYKTGDLVRWNEEGYLEFIGRIDNQVKIRGYRIETAEVEFALLKTQQISDCVVVIQRTPRDENILVAYTVLKRNTLFSAHNLRLFLRRYLPYYMIPDRFVQLDALPMTKHGKVDRQSLSTFCEEIVDREKTEHMTAEQKILCEILSKLLYQSHVAIDDNFFDLGGNSLVAFRYIIEISRYFLISPQVKDIFNYPTIREFTEQFTLVKIVSHDVG